MFLIPETNNQYLESKNQFPAYSGGDFSYILIKNQKICGFISKKFG
jgi:hypothetical protein